MFEQRDSLDDNSDRPPLRLEISARNEDKTESPPPPVSQLSQRLSGLQMTAWLFSPVRTRPILQSQLPHRGGLEVLYGCLEFLALRRLALGGGFYTGVKWYVEGGAGAGEWKGWDGTVETARREGRNEEWRSWRRNGVVSREEMRNFITGTAVSQYGKLSGGKNRTWQQQNAYSRHQSS